MKNPLRRVFYFTFTNMNVTELIQQHIATLSTAKQKDILDLHALIIETRDEKDIQFFDGKDEKGKVVANPTIGYGKTKLIYKDGSHQDTFRIGLSANSTGISIYVLGLEDKNFLKENFATRIGKAKVTGYCIRFSKLTDVDSVVLQEIVHV